MDWTETDIARLRSLWGKGLSTAAIGREMNISKNAVVGKAHRLNLPGRPSPIRRDGIRSPRRHQIKRVLKNPTLGILDSIAAPPATEAAAAQHNPAQTSALATETSDVNTHAFWLSGGVVGDDAKQDNDRGFIARRLAMPRSVCEWPLWSHKGRPTHFYCGEDAVLGHPYCDKHCRIAFTTYTSARAAERAFVDRMERSARKIAKVVAAADHELADAA